MFVIGSLCIKNFYIGFQSLRISNHFYLLKINIVQKYKYPQNFTCVLFSNWAIYTIAETTDPECMTII